MPAGNQYSVLDSRDLVADFYPRLEAAMESIWAPLVAAELSSDRGTEEYAWLGQVPAMRKWVGGRAEEFLNKYTLSIQNFPYEATLPISIDDLRRDKTTQIRQRISDLAVRTATHWNSLLGTLIANGEAGTSGLAYDGQFFFDTDHNESGTNQTNDLTATEVPASDVATASTLTTTEAANIITQTLAHMMSLTDDKGEPINAQPTNVVILCTKVGHYNGLKTALGLNNLGTGSGNNNPVLAWSDFAIRVEYVPVRVTAADKLYFFFGNPGMGTTPLIRQNEVSVQTTLIGAGSEEEFKNRRHLFGVEAVRGVGYGMWQKAALVTLT
jgi:phage major head subunit gpT-like protein